MAGDVDQGVNEVSERIEIAPSGSDDMSEDETEGTDPDSPQGNEGDTEGEEDPENDPDDESPDGKPESIHTPAVPVEGTAPDTEPSDRKLPDETPREYARRLEIEKLRGQLRTQRTSEVLDTVVPVNAGAPRTEVSPATQELLSKYKPEELNALREVLPVLAAEMGFVRKDEIAGTSYKDKVQEELDGFVERHPEYSPENDPDGTLWGRFKDEFGQYKQPANPKDYKRLFEKVHQSVFGIQAGDVLPKVQAQQQKVRVASHAGASGPTAPSRNQRSQGNSSGLRLDALKGFSDEDKQRIASRATGE